MEFWEPAAGTADLVTMERIKTLHTNRLAWSPTCDETRLLATCKVFTLLPLRELNSPVMMTTSADILTLIDLPMTSAPQQP